MSTKVILDGAMGKKFGKEWDLFVDSPAAAVRLIEANNPEFSQWIRENLNNYEGYKVTCEYDNGLKSSIDESELHMCGKIRKIRFTPVLEGSGNTAKIIAGVVLIAVAAAFTFGVGAIGIAAGFGMGFAASTVTTIGLNVAMMGAAMMMSGIAGIISPQPLSGTSVNSNSKYFSGPVNTSVQGTPVQLIYGRCLVGSHAISASLTVNESVITGA